MRIRTCPPLGLVAPTVFTWEKMPICESGVYSDKFGQIHRHMFFDWKKNFSLIPIYLEHLPISAPFFGYVSNVYVEGETLLGDMCFTKYGVNALKEYKDRHMGSGWSVGICEGRHALGEVSLCRVPRVSTTHILTLRDANFPTKDLSNLGMRDENGVCPIGDELIESVMGVIRHETTKEEWKLLEQVLELQIEMLDANGQVLLGDDFIKQLMVHFGRDSKMDEWGLLRSVLNLQKITLDNNIILPGSENESEDVD